MQITPADWKLIRRVLRDSLISSLHCAVASRNEDGSPHVTPIGSLVLTGVGHGFYFEEYAPTLARNLERDPRVCVMALNSRRWLLFSALLRGRAVKPFGVRLDGTAGERRPATAAELERLGRRVRAYRFLRGHRMVWGRMRAVREIRFHSFEPVLIPPLGRDPWPARERSPGESATTMGIAIPRREA